MVVTSELMPALLALGPYQLIVLGILFALPAVLETREMLWMGEIDWTPKRRRVVWAISAVLVSVGIAWALVAG